MATEEQEKGFASLTSPVDPGSVKRHTEGGAKTSFTLDTSGEIVLPYPHLHPWPRGYRWSDLDPFTQGYVEALFADIKPIYAALREPGGRGWSVRNMDTQQTVQIFDTREDALAHATQFNGEPLGVQRAFSDLAPETLARIIADCERFREGFGKLREREAAARLDGAYFFGSRQRGEQPGFPPLTITLGDDGKVYLRDAQS